MTIHRLWPSTEGPATSVSDSVSYTLGTEFSVTASGDVISVPFWRPASSPAIVVGVGIFQITGSSAGTLLASKTGISIPANLGAWFDCVLDSRLAIVPGVSYLAAVQSNTSNFYSSTAAYWTSGAGAAGVASGILRAPQSGAVTGGAGQSRFRDGATTLQYPSSSFNGSNYWIDVKVDDNVPEIPPVQSVPLLLENGVPLLAESGSRLMIEGY